MKPKFTQVCISEKQAKALLDFYLCAKANDSRDLVEIYGREILSQLAELGLITSGIREEVTNFYLTGTGLELAQILEHEKNGTTYHQPHLRIPIPEGGSN